MWNLSHFTFGIVLGHRLDAFVPIGHGDRDAIGLGRRGQMLLRPRLRQVEADFRMRSTPMRVITVCCVTISRSVSGNMLPPTEEYSPSVFSRTTQKSMSPGLRFASGEARRASATPGAN